MKTIKLFSLVLLASLLYTLPACKKDSDKPAGSSQVMIHLTDAPGPYEAVNVNIVGIEIHSDVSGWQNLPLSRAGIYDLLHFSNGIDTLIASSSLPSGKISQLRLILGDSNSVVIGGTAYPLETPSAQQSGLKIQIHKTLEPGITYVILLDFDAAKSIVETGSGKYILKPVIRAITQGIDGGIKGVLSPANRYPVFAIQNADTTGGFSNTTGSFLINGLQAGNYRVVVRRPNPWGDTTIVSSAIVTTGNITDIGTRQVQ